MEASKFMKSQMEGRRRPTLIMLMAFIAVSVLVASGRALFRAPLAHADGLCTTDCYVALSGDNTSGDGQQGAPFATVQKAVDTVQAGGTVHVGSGTFTEQVTISKALTLSGEGAASTTIQMPNPTYGNASSIIVSAAGTDSVAITGLTVSTNDVCGAAIDILGGNLLIQNNTIAAANPNGLCVSVGINQEAGTSEILSNTISGYTGAGVWVLNSASASISGNTITGGSSHLGQQAGVSVDDSASAGVSGNTISGNQCVQSTYPPPGSGNTCEYDVTQPQMGAGVSFGTSGSVFVTDNTFTGNDIGVRAYEAGSAMAGANSITSTYVGILSYAPSLGLQSNHVNGGQYGIAVVGYGAPAPGLTGVQNTISDTGTGVYIFDDSHGIAPPVVTLNRNAITGNTAGYNNTSGAAQDATCNWWGDDSGPSGVGPGSGDSVSSNVTFVPWLVTSDLANAPCTGAGTSATTTTASATYYDWAPVPTVAITAHVDSGNSAIYDESGTGTASFYNGSTLLCTVPLEYGEALCESAIDPSTVSPHSLTVIYNGTAAFLTSTTTTDVVKHLAQPTFVTITSVFPNSGNAWLLQGGGFSGARSVTVCGVSVPFTVISDNTMLVGVPKVDAPKQCAVSVVAAGGVGSSNGNVTVVPKPQPGAPVVVFPTGPSTPSTPTTPTCGTTTDISLSGLWTLVAWPVADAPVGDALSGGDCGNDVTSKVSVIWGFDAATQTYQAYFPSATAVLGANDLETLTRGLGYWVALKDASEAVTWAVVTA
jgi:nitrous oxidase accessory protein NosD